MLERFAAVRAVWIIAIAGRRDDKAVGRGASEKTGIGHRLGIAGGVSLKAFAPMVFPIEVAVA